MLKDPNEKINVPSRGGGSINITGLTPSESDILNASIRGGHHWVRRDSQGRLESFPSWEPMLDPMTDDNMLPFWQPAGDNCQVQLEMFYPTDTFDMKKYYQQCSFTIHALCAYSYTKENYRRQADLLTEYGFSCFRSPRDAVTGQYSEIWHLPGLWAAKGGLKEYVDKKGHSHPILQAKDAVYFLSRNAKFGSMDVSVQRIATVMD